MDALKMGIAEKKKRFVGPCWVRFALYPQKWIMRLSCESVPNRKNRYSVSKPGRIRQRRHRPSDRPWAERELERPRKHALRKFGQLTSAYAQVRGGLEISKFFFHFGFRHLWSVTSGEQGSMQIWKVTNNSNSEEYESHYFRSSLD